MGSERHEGEQIMTEFFWVCLTFPFKSETFLHFEVMTVTKDFFGRLIDFDGTCTYLSEGHIIICSVQINSCYAEVLANW